MDGHPMYKNPIGKKGYPKTPLGGSGGFGSLLGHTPNPGIYPSTVFGQSAAGPSALNYGGMGGGLPGGGLSSTPTFPGFDDLQSELQRYRTELAAGTDLDATNAMSRQRDLASGMAAEAGQNAAFRVGSGSGIPARMAAGVLGDAARDMAGMNAQMATQGRQQRLSALMGEADVLGNKANINLAQQQFGANWWNMQQQNQLAWQQAQALRDDRLWQLIANMYQG